MTKEEIFKGVYDGHGRVMEYKVIYEAMQTYAWQETAELKAEVERLKEELDGLNMAYKQACDAAGSYEQRAREAEKEVRNILNDIER